MTDILLLGEKEASYFSDMQRRSNEQFATSYTSVFQKWMVILSNPENVPMVFHCTAGKDRTGFAVAILLLSLRVSKEDVIENYLKVGLGIDAKTKSQF